MGASSHTAFATNKFIKNNAMLDMTLQNVSGKPTYTSQIDPH